jgi:hypothetical protein
VTPSKKIFCNTPWYELHIYWDGSLGICCQEDHKLYAKDQTQYNIASMSIAEWFQSEPVKDFRRRILGNTRVSECSRCYIEEDHGGDSRRLRSNQKSVIFTKQAFEQSFKQSPGYGRFSYSFKNQGATETHPIDLHIDLGNFCNLACKMCNAKASSTIASQEVRWGIESSREYLGQDWTRNQQTWNRFKQDLLTIQGLNNIHFMGGETLLTDRLEDLIDFMIDNNKFDLNLSFVTNGTVLNLKLIEKLKHFQRVGIEVSIETVDEHNAYQRQGTDTNLVLANIDRYLELCNGSSVTLALRPAPSLLTVGYYHSLLKYALDKALIVKSNLCYDPRYLAIDILPTHIKQLYQGKYKDLISQFDQIKNLVDYNASDPNNYQQVIKQQAQMCLNLLESPTPPDSESQLELMVRHCERWDRIYGLNARVLYPEFEEILDRYGYTTSS